MAHEYYIKLSDKAILQFLKEDNVLITHNNSFYKLDKELSNQIYKKNIRR